MNYKFMKLDELVEYINLQLEKKRTFLEIATKDFSCNESTLRKRLTGKKLYKRIGNKYIRQCRTVADEDRNIESIQDVRQCVRQDVTSGNSTQIIAETKSQSVTVSLSDNEKFLGMISSYDLIIQIL